MNSAEAELELLSRSKAADHERRRRFCAERCVTNGETNCFQKAMELIKIRDSSVSTAGLELPKKKAPSLMDMSLKVLSENFRSIESLICVPDHLRTKLSFLIGGLDMLDYRFFRLLIQGFPNEICVKQCPELNENELTQILCDCDRDKLKVLHLDFCGQSTTDQAFTNFLERSRNGFPALRNLSLREAASLTDKGLTQLLISAPLLLYIDVSHCNLLTSHSVKILAERFGSSLKGLYIEDCSSIKPDDVFRISLMKFEKLSSLSVSEQQNFRDAVLSFITLHGYNLTELFLSGCKDLNEEFFWTIGAYCPKLETLDLSLCRLSEKSFGRITEGCRHLKSVYLRNAPFRDEALAAFIEVSGSWLNQLYLDGTYAGENTANSIAKVCKTLDYLDLSWCSKLKEEDVRLILLHCLSLKSINLHGCHQMKDKFLKESNVLVKEWRQHSPTPPHA